MAMLKTAYSDGLTTSIAAASLIGAAISVPVCAHATQFQMGVLTEYMW